MQLSCKDKPAKNFLREKTAMSCWASSDHISSCIISWNFSGWGSGSDFSRASLQRRSCPSQFSRWGGYFGWRVFLWADWNYQFFSLNKLPTNWEISASPTRLERQSGLWWRLRTTRRTTTATKFSGPTDPRFSPPTTSTSNNPSCKVWCHRGQRKKFSAKTFQNSQKQVTTP